MLIRYIAIFVKEVIIQVPQIAAFIIYIYQSIHRLTGTRQIH